MRHGVIVAAAILGSVAGVHADEPVRKSRCPAMGRGLVVVGHYFADGRTGDPNGSGGTWVSPPAGLLPSPQMEAEYLSQRVWDTPWDPAATADFDGDGTCDIVWTLQRTGGIALTRSDSSVSPPSFRAPSDADVFGALDGWTVVGSGDFVGTTVPAGAEDVGGTQEGGLPPPAGHADLLLWHPVARRLRVWTGSGTGKFPPDQRHEVAVATDDWEAPAVVANLDGAGPPEIIWLNHDSRRLSYSRIEVEPSGLRHVPAGQLHPETLESGWSIRAADDLDGDRNEDLVVQDEKSEESGIWFMDGARRRGVSSFSPHKLIPPGSTDPGSPEQRWPILGPR